MDSIIVNTTKTTKSLTSNCSVCGEDIDKPKDKIKKDNIKFCDDCREKENKRRYINQIKKVIPRKYWKIKDKYGMTDNIENFINKNLYMYGPQGTGKTTLATFIAKYYLKHRVIEMSQRSKPNVKFVSMPEKIFNLQYNMDERDREIKKLKKTSKLLILDDFAVSKPTDFVVQVSYLIIDYREKYELPTIITSNLNLKQIKEHYNPRLSSRITGMCKTVMLTGKDKRVEDE